MNDRLETIMTCIGDTKDDSPWIKVHELCEMTGLTRREIRELSHERGYAESNKGLAKLERLTPQEALSALRRTRNKALSGLKKLKHQEIILRRAGTLPIEEIEAAIKIQENT